MTGLGWLCVILSRSRPYDSGTMSGDPQGRTGGRGRPGGKDAPLFAYRHSGARSGRAVRLLARMGYPRARNIGGMAACTERVEY